MTGRPRALAALVVFALALALYAWTAAPGVLFGDSGEFQTVANVGGIPHATGYPAFLAAGRAFATLPFADPAYRINFMSAFFGAAALAAFVLFAGELGAGVLASALAAAIYATTYTLWRVSLRAEVYTIALFLGVLAVGWTLVALRTGRLRDALAAGLLLGLTLVGHLSFAAPVAVLGLALAWRIGRAAPRPASALGPLSLLLLAFVVGLSPYLSIVWLDGRELRMNYFDLVMQAKNPLGLPRPDFDTSWERLWWMLTGKNTYPPEPGAFGPKDSLVHVVESGVILVLFELGVVASALAAFGGARVLRRDPRAAWTLGAALAATVLYAAHYETGAILQLFLIPAVLLLAWLAAAGIQGAFDALVARGWGSGARVALALAVLAAVVVPNQLVRRWTSAHPIGPRAFRVEEEDAQIAPTGFFPHMRGFDRPGALGERIFAATPQGALVLAGWAEFNVLRYRQLVLGDREDVALQLMTPESLPVRLALWQRDHDPAERPFVFVGKVEGLAPHYGRLDSLAVGPKSWVYVQREPIRNAPPIAAGAP
jgi:hypothetical protein